MPSVPTTTEPLSAAMRTGSQAEHEAAESSAFMTELLAGRVDEAGYAAYLARFRPVYAALEQAVRDRLDHPAVAAVHDPALERLAAIDADLAYWEGRAGRAEILVAADSPAVAAYTTRIAQASDAGALLVAHHYTRYLGDLSGGQAIGRILDRTFGLHGQGIAFYEFVEVPKPKPYKDAYRTRLDALPLDAEEREQVVEEVRVAFRLNRTLFAELGERLDDYRR